MGIDNLVLLTDSYKISHYRQYPAGTSEVYSYFESRGGAYNEVVFFGLQYYLKKYLSTRITQEQIEEAAAICTQHFGDASLFNRQGWEHILKYHDGYLPVSIKAVPEGMVIPTKNVLMTIENTDPAAYWLTNYLETLLVQVWYGCTVATNSREMKRHLLKALDRSGDPSTIAFKLHDFGFRGVSSVETAAVGGAAHLVNFMGTDTIAGIIMAREYYGAEMPGFSIPAAEHSTITSWTREQETAAYENMLEVYPEGFVAVVSDSYDIFNACRNIWGDTLREKVLTREGTLVIRPDSGDPREMLPLILATLGEVFPCTTNEKGYRALPSQVRLIQGDGVGPDTLPEILEAVMAAGWSIDNLSFGSGGGLLQRLDRDTLSFAFKCSSAVVDGKRRDVYKQPVTAPWKSSKRGRLKLVERDGSLLTVGSEETSREEDFLQEVYRNGRVLIEENFDIVRKRAEIVCI
ncbi:nicotinate phosphoribosyltransferase [Gloeocapsa sp. PCC 73106]|uniref:nicotinate phosphoribosyltransferase n=1 Tax=Gloeocapsa sp. PCC 73106 TaxID=102232 RepID=UPI0002ACCB02|nr:nicotinate phosphoribosyltransferase [Gloeocapsa sp. PCC 73106]ELR98097.1 nicotinic acid phosphoribosyltransferase [Gloeocapsa sp. PCC 73106]